MLLSLLHMHGPQIAVLGAVAGTVIGEKAMAETAEQQLVRQEGGKKTKVYHDKYGFHTAGIGHNIDAHGIDDTTIMRWFTEDYHMAQFDLVTRLPWTIQLDPVRRDVLVNLSFNMGIHRLLEFKNMLAALENKDYVTAAKELLNSKWKNDVGPERANELAENLRTGIRK